MEVADDVAEVKGEADKKAWVSPAIFVGLLNAILKGRLTASSVCVYSQDFEVFMQELEEDADLRSQIRLYKGKIISSAVSTIVVVS